MTDATIPRDDQVIVRGDMDGEVTLENGSSLIVDGHLRGRVRSGGPCELVVMGDVKAGAGTSRGISLFVGGDMAGSLRTDGCSTVWVCGHLTGDIRTGNPVTRVWCLGDCAGSFVPERGGMLYLAVAGYMPSAALDEIATASYTAFQASVGESDQPAGLYPSPERYQALARRRSYVRWVIHRTKDDTSPDGEAMPDPRPGW